MTLSGQWITNGTNAPFYARKTFRLERAPLRARAKVCGLGQFQLFVNGAKVDSRVLDPAWTDYRKSVNYVTFDLTPYLREGDNVLAAEVGNGWFHLDPDHYVFHFPPFMPENPNPYRPFSQVLMLIADVTIEWENGEVLSFGTDDSFVTAPHPIRRTNVFGSETMDCRARIPGWADAGLDDSSWERARFVPREEIPAGALCEQTIPPVRVIRSYEGKFLHMAGGRSVYDFGQNAAGMLRFQVRGKRGQEVHAYPAEKLGPDGDVDQMAKNWVPIDVTETCILGSDDAWEDFAMTFTYIGARYVAFDTQPENLRDIVLDAVSSAGKRSGSFSCDDERLMKIYDLVEKSVEANMLSVHTDCPTIERFAWQEENHLMAPAVMYMKDVKPHWEKFLKDTREAQHGPEDSFSDGAGGRYCPGDGLVPSQAPCYMPNVLPVPGLGDFYSTIGWGSSILLGTRWHYLFYGDLRVVEDNYEAGVRYLSYLATLVNGDGFINNGLGDWGNPDGVFARENIETALYYADVRTAAGFAALLGREKDRERFAELAEGIRAGYNEKLLTRDPETGLSSYRLFDHPEGFATSQAALAMPLYFGMVPEERIPEVAESLRRRLLRDGCLRTGEVGQPYIMQAMASHGMNDLLADFITRPEHPSYYAFVLDGETTLGEYWESNPRSHCHDMMGHIGEWFYNGIAGIRPAAPGFAKAIVKPWMPACVNRFECSYETPRGAIVVKGERIDGIPRFDIRIPEGILAVDAPDESTPLMNW